MNIKIKTFKQIYYPQEQIEHPIFVPTGVFIQSFEFVRSNTVKVSGYVWQKISEKDLKSGITPGIVFPEANEHVDIKLAYKIDYPDYKVFGWNFTGVSLLQRFDYSTFPFDIHAIWIRLWAKDFERNVVLVPDLISYDSTSVGKVFGLEKDIIKQGFDIQETFFDMPAMVYDSDFGIASDVGQKASLEFYFNIVLKRDLFTPFIIHLLPLFLIWCILFFVTMMVTVDKHQNRETAATATNLFAVLDATVFSVLILHIGFRRSFVDQPLLYLEYFYLITYILIIIIAYDVYNVTTNLKATRLIKRNLLPKTWFWPGLLLAVLVITIIEFFIIPHESIHWYN